MRKVSKEKRNEKKKREEDKMRGEKTRKWRIS